MSTPLQTVNVLRASADLVTETRHGSPSMLQRRLHRDWGIFLGHPAAKTLLVDLYAAGIIGPLNPATHAHPVLMDRADAAAALEAHADRVQAWSTLYECRSCYRVALWTDGRKTALGDETDEFWCQACGDEVPLSACTVITSA